MLIQSLLIPKEKLVVATIDFNLEQALSLMEDNTLRSLPVLDDTKQLYRGSIYRYHIYRHLAHGGSLNQSVMILLKNATKFIYDTDSFYTLFFKLNDLPYISVLDKKHHFLGIVKHDDVMTMLSESWQLTHASFALTIEIPEDTTSFLEAIKIVKKHTNIAGLLTFERDHFTSKKRIILTLPEKIADSEYDKLKQHLNKKGFSIIEIEDLNDGI